MYDEEEVRVKNILFTSYLFTYLYELFQTNNKNIPNLLQNILIWLYHLWPLIMRRYRFPISSFYSATNQVNNLNQCDR